MDSERSDSTIGDLIRDLRDVGTDKFAHTYGSSCPNVQREGSDTEHDRADPQEECAACEVLRRADTFLSTPEHSPVGVLAMIDRFREDMLACLPDGKRVQLDLQILTISKVVGQLEYERDRALREAEKWRQEWSSERDRYIDHPMD